MSRDYAELEREFIDGLAADTGRDVAQWMALIDGQTFAHRNDMIDWLRRQGLTFAKASRLERIHHNGGKPLYGERPVLKAAPDEPAAAPRPAANAVIEPPPPVVAAPVVANTAPAVPTPPSTDDAAALAAFLTKAKGYRPLAELLLRAIRTAVPATRICIHDTHADLAAPAVYGAIAVTAKDVRLALNLGEHPFEGDLKRLRLAGTAPTLTHTIVLTDARRINADLAALIAKAAARTNS